MLEEVEVDTTLRNQIAAYMHEAVNELGFLQHPVDPTSGLVKELNQLSYVEACRLLNSLYLNREYTLLEQTDGGTTESTSSIPNLTKLEELLLDTDVLRPQRKWIEDINTLDHLFRMKRWGLRDLKSTYEKVVSQWSTMKRQKTGLSKEVRSTFEDTWYYWQKFLQTSINIVGEDRTLTGNADVDKNTIAKFIQDLAPIDPIYHHGVCFQVDTLGAQCPAFIKENVLRWKNGNETVMDEGRNLLCLLWGFYGYIHKLFEEWVGSLTQLSGTYAPTRLPKRPVSPFPISPRTSPVMATLLLNESTEEYVRRG